MQFENRALMSITLPFTGGTTDFGNGNPSLFTSVGLTASRPVVSGNSVNFSFTNNGASSIRIGISTYYEAQDPPNVLLGTQVLKGVEYLDVAAHTTRNVGLPLQPCTQYDAFINYVGTRFESGVVNQFSRVFLDPQNNTFAAPSVDGGYNTQGFQPTTPNTPIPSGLLGTLVAYAQSTDTSNGTGRCPPPPPLDCGSTTTTCFWNGERGQDLIDSLGRTSTDETVGQWLVQSFPNLFGSYANPNGVTSSDQATSDAAVAALYRSIFDHHGGSDALTGALDLALTSYVTDESLNTSAASRALARSDGFTVSNLIAGVAGTGGKTYSLSTSDATALGLTLPNDGNGNHFSVTQILVALGHYAQSHSSISTFSCLLDRINTSCDCGGDHSGDDGGDGGDSGDGGDGDHHNGGGD